MCSSDADTPRKRPRGSVAQAVADADLLDFTMDTSHMTRGALGLPARAVELDPVAAKLEADRRAAPHIAEALAAKGKLPPG